MSRMPRLRRSPAMIVAIIALVAAVGGSAYAVGGLTGKQKKQVRKIATKVFNKNIGKASVAHASTADNATNAKNANSAKSADTAKSAKSADTAKDAEKLGGLPASKYQQVIQGACPKNGAYGSIGSEGGAACVIPVRPIVIDQVEGDPVTGVSAGTGLEVRNVCHDGGMTKVIFRSTVPSATLNWFYSDGSAVHASGASLGSGAEREFQYLGTGARIEGQFIWSDGSTVITVNLHAFSGEHFCEIRGTAEGATA
jgi:hypothetical protein